MHSDIIKNITELSQPIIEQDGMFLVDVEIKHQKIPEIWVLVDTEKGGISVDVCSKISREISREIENQDLFDGAYRLNVSSPGLSRPLSDKRQYAKNRGRPANVKYKENDNYTTAEGIIDQVSDDQITMKLDDGSTIDIPFSFVAETKIIPKI